MKKLVLTAAAVLIITSCGGADNNIETPTDPPVQTGMPVQTEAPGVISDYFPVRTNTNYHYESPGNNELTQDIYITYTGGSRVQRRAASNKVSSTEVLQYQEGELRLVFGEPNFYFFEDLTSVEPMTDMLLLKEPLIKGQKWDLDSTGVSEITALDISVPMPGGDLQAMEVTTIFTDGRKQKEYYSKGVGLIKTVYTTTDGRSLEILLTDVTEQTALLVSVDFFYPDAGSEAGYGKEERQLQINTNSDLASLFTEQLKTEGQSGYTWLAGGAVIDSIEVDRVNDTAIVTFSDNEGINSEEGIQTLADTLGHFYGVSKVRPEVPGSDFTAGGKTFGPLDFITVTVEEDQIRVSPEEQNTVTAEEEQITVTTEEAQGTVY